jgi:hypothetical protein
MDRRSSHRFLDDVWPWLLATCLRLEHEEGQPLNRHVYGCACCSGYFGDFLKENQSVKELKVKAAQGWSCNWGVDWSTVGRREFLKGGVLSAGLMALPGGKAKAQAEATTVFVGGKVLTVDADFSEAEAIAIRGERILAVGSEAKVREAAGADATVVDLGGKTVLPGFIDAHMGASTRRSISRTRHQPALSPLRSSPNISPGVSDPVRLRNVRNGT